MKYVVKMTVKTGLTDGTLGYDPSLDDAHFYLTTDRVWSDSQTKAARFGSSADALASMLVPVGLIAVHVRPVKLRPRA